jgi:hypothetical protein
VSMSCRANFSASLTSICTVRSVLPSVVCYSRLREEFFHDKIRDRSAHSSGNMGDTSCSDAESCSVNLTESRFPPTPVMCSQQLCQFWAIQTISQKFLTCMIPI